MKEFIRYEEALALKELGFDEPCIIISKQLIYRNGNLCEADDGALEFFNNNKDEIIIAPIYSQVFRWFREKYKLYSCVFFENDTQYYFQYVDTDNIVTLNTDHKTYEEAELACLKKLIDIVKDK